VLLIIYSFPCCPTQAVVSIFLTVFQQIITMYDDDDDFKVPGIAELN